MFETKRLDLVKTISYTENVVSASIISIYRPTAPLTGIGAGIVPSSHCTPWPKLDNVRKTFTVGTE